YIEWKQPWPASEAQLRGELSGMPQGVRSQERLLYSLLRPANLLDIVKNFVVFETRSGLLTKKLCRYKQFVAVNEAIARVTAPKGSAKRGGVVWHTQGSGKSLTMLWLALKLRRDPRLENPGLVIVTDRTSLDKQITGTFERAGVPAVRAETVRELRDLLANVTGKTVMTTIQKFQELRAEGSPAAKGGTRRADRTRMPVLTDATNVVVMVDEAHRSQYRSLATNMRTALPNAAFIGFTGTPIDKKDKSTLQTFGPYIDRYTIEQAVADGATVEIRYEGRMPDLRIEGRSLDWLFEREFSDRTKQERAQIKQQFATPQALAEAPRRITAICEDLIRHFEDAIAPNGFKAQLATVSREAAVTYYDTITRLRGPSAAVVISSKHNEDNRCALHAKTQPQIDALVDAFCDPGQEPQILIVCDRLLTGFDAPVEQVLYIDKPLREHNLLQAIARTNRRYTDTKTHGLVVDYWGISDKLDEALSLFTAEDVQGAMTPKADELPRLEARHQAVLRFFERVPDKGSLDPCVRALDDDDVFAGFEAAFRKFAQSLDMLYPEREALRFVSDAKWLGKVLKAARARADRAGPDLSDCGAKVRRLIEEAVVADGVQILVTQAPLLSAEFEQKIRALGSDEARASEMEHAIRHEIHVKLEEDPAFYESLRERLERLVQDYKDGRITAAEKFQLALALSTEFTQGQAKSAEGLGLGRRGFAIFGLLRAGGVDRATGAAEAPPGYGTAHKQQLARLRDLASLIDDAIDPFTQYVDWRKKNDVLKEMKRRVAKQLRVAGHEPAEAKRLAADIVRLASARDDIP
ncbi:MAG: type I restriction endonuclease subunit R, partial [Myxococcales bacterium]|nr:type I restriction endonuclease subunit R [Myxococcales bacterium]